MDAIKFSLVVGPVYGIGVWFGASLFGKASEDVFRCDLLRADRGRGDFRPAGAGWRAA